MSGGVLHVHRSNRVERLVDVVDALWSRPAAGVDPIFEPEHVVVPSRGMARWLQLELAARRGVVANVRWWLPRELADKALAGVGGDPVEPWGRDRLAWAVLAALPSLLSQPAFGPVRAWLGEAAADPARRWELARRVADVFDRYAVHRPGLVRAWAAGAEPGDWQAELWRHLEGVAGAGHAAALVERLEAGVAPEGLPARLVLFGITTLPPLYVRVLQRVAERSEVHLLGLTPSAAWFADLRRRGAPALDAGHPLLRTLARVGADFQAVVEEHAPGYVDDDQAVEVPGAGLLATLQRGMLEGVEPEARAPLVLHDDSLQVHGCHSPAREVEVLRDQLWRLLRDRPDLGPRDVLVLVPDISVHGPLIDAVFGVDPSDPLHLPYAIADRPVASGNGVARALLELLRLVGARLTVTQVVDLLAHAPLRERFGLAEAEVGAVEGLLGLAGVRWGRDAAHRVAEGQPAEEAYTWRFGLERLLLGHAVDAELTVDGVSPVIDVEGDAADLVGRVADLVEAVTEALDALAVSRSPEGWRAHLEALLEGLLVPEDEEEVQRVREVLVALVDEATAAGWTGELPLGVVRSLLEARLLEERRQGAFLRGGITFCELLPMRSVPARVVAVLGLSDGDFPRSDARIDFDRMVTPPSDPAAPRALQAHVTVAGDRSRRNDDRYLVLEALLSARDVLLLSYVSRSVQDNAPLPPSVVLADLLDAVDACFEGPPGPDGRPTRARDAVVLHHPLQPFSPHYVVPDDPPDPRLITFDADAARGAEALLRGTQAPRPFLEGALPGPAPVEEVELSALVEFVKDPVLWFHARRLGIARPDELTALPEREPLELGVLDDLSAGQRLLELHLAGLDWLECADQLRAEALLPLGQLANAWLRRASRRVKRIAAEAHARLQQPVQPPRVVDLSLAGVRLVGRLDDLRDGDRVEVRYQKVGADRIDRQLGLWVPHLALQLAGGAGVSELHAFAETGGLLRAGALVAYAPVPVAEAREALAQLVTVFLEGHARPVPFLPNQSAVVVEKLRCGEAEGSVRWTVSQAAEKWWEHRDASRAAWAHLCGGSDALLTEEAVEVAGRILDPLRALGRRP